MAYGALQVLGKSFSAISLLTPVTVTLELLFPQAKTVPSFDPRDNCLPVNWADTPEPLNDAIRTSGFAAVMLAPVPH